MSSAEIIGEVPSATAADQRFIDELAFRAAVKAGRYVPSWETKELEVLPEPPEEEGWEARAACREMGNQEFFAPDGTRGRQVSSHEARAKAICRRCPVIQECLKGALERDEEYGVWGGLSTSERKVLRPKSVRRRRKIA